MAALDRPAHTEEEGEDFTPRLTEAVAEQEDMGDGFEDRFEDEMLSFLDNEEVKLRKELAALIETQRQAGMSDSNQNQEEEKNDKVKQKLKRKRENGARRKEEAKEKYRMREELDPSEQEELKGREDAVRKSLFRQWEMELQLAGLERESTVLRRRWEESELFALRSTPARIGKRIVRRPKDKE